MNESAGRTAVSSDISAGRGKLTGSDLREQVEVLLLARASELDQLSDLPGWPRAKQPGDWLTYAFVQRRPRFHAALRTRLPRPRVS